MAQQLPETRMFTGGIDTNTTRFDIGPNASMNIVNARALAADGQNSGELDFLKGNVEVTAVTALLAAGTNTLLGRWAAAENGCLYLLYHSSTDGGYILEHNIGTGVARTLITDARVTGGLGFTASMFISARMVDGKLFWCNIALQPSYLTLAVDYMSGPVLDAETILLIKSPPALPLQAARTTVTGASSTIQFRTLQFAWRFINVDDFTTVLSPKSATSFATRSSEVSGAPDTNNAITLTAPTDQKIPANWKFVEFVAYFPDNVSANQYYVIKRWSASEIADVTAVDNHNAGSALTFSNWDGTLLEQLDSAYASKPFDNVPNNSGFVEAAANRLMLAHNIAGFDTPTEQPAITKTPVTFIPVAPTSTLADIYRVMWFDGSSKWYFVTIYRDVAAGLNYLLPMEYGSGIIKADNPFPATSVLGDHRPLEERISAFPIYVPKQQLTLLNESRDPGIAAPLTYPPNGSFAPPWTGDLSVYGSNVNFAGVLETRYNIVEEAHKAGLTYDPAGSTYGILGYAGQTRLEDAPNEFGPSNKRRVFKPGSIQYGVQYFDGAERKSGVLPCGSHTIATLGAPNDTSTESVYLEQLQLGMPAGTQTCIPLWARYYAQTITYSQRCSRFIQFSAGIIHPVIMNQDDQLEFADTAVLSGSLPLGQTLYGLAIPLSALHRDNLGYAFSPGDFIEYGTEIANTLYTGQAPIKEVWNGHIIVPFIDGQNMDLIASGMQKNFSFDFRSASTSPFQTFFNGGPSGTTSYQNKVMISVCTPQNDINQYEVPHFGAIVDPGQPTRSFGPFSSSGTTTAAIFGDAHTQKRVSSSGSFTGLSMTTYEVGATLKWVTDIGRIAPIDRIGQKRLSGQIARSNVHIPGTSTNGYASFDALDTDNIEESAGAITGMMLSTRGGEQQGGQLIIYCTNGMFTALVGQQQLADAAGEDSVTIAAKVIGNVNASNGSFGTTAPRSVARHQFHVWSADVLDGVPVEFNASGANDIAFGLARLLRQTFARVAGTADETGISIGVNPYTKEILLSIPASAPALQTDLNTVTGLSNPFDAYVNQPATWLYNYEHNTWQSRYTSGAEFMNIGNDIFGWHPQTGKLWHEFTGTPGHYYGADSRAMVALPFNQGSGLSKTPMALHLIARRAPDQTWVMCDDGSLEHVAGVADWKRITDGWETAIRRDRTSFGAVAGPDWEESGISGNRLKGIVVNVVMIWEAAGGPIRAKAVTLHSNIELGQTLPK